jgi:translocation and assembly module TamB
LSDNPPPRRGKWWKYLLAFVAICVAAFGFLAWYVTTDSFRQIVLRRLVASLESATGGRVEIGSFHTIPMRLRVEVRDLTIHGRESADQVPYLHVDRLQAELKIISLFEKEVGLRTLTLEHPVVHIIIYPDGSTNQPALKISTAAKKAPVEQLFSMSVSRVDVERGELLWDLQKIPLDFHGRDVSLGLSYSFLRQRYEARVALGSVATKIQQYPAFEWRGDASLVLYRDHADVTALTVSSGKSQMHFSGAVQNFQNPQVVGNYRGIVDLPEWAGLFDNKAIRRGTASFDGKGSWNLQDFSGDGMLLVNDFDWLDSRMKLQNSKVSANYSVTPQRLRLTSLKMNGLGGELAGDVDVVNWQTSLAPDTGRHRRVLGRIPAGSLQRGSVRIQLNGFSLSPLIQTLSSKKLPLDQLRMVGSVNGAIEMLWVGSIRDAETRMNLTIAAPAKTTPSDLPVRAEVSGVYQGSRDELQLDRFKWNTPASELNAQGNLASTSSLRLSASSHNLTEWNPLLRAAFGQNLPFTVSGWINFNGNASGRISNFQLNGNLEVYDFHTMLPARPQREASTVHWDSLTGLVQYTNNNLAIRNGALIHGQAIARIEASTALVKGVPTDNTPFTARVDVRNADIAEWEQLAGFNYPLTGTADFTLHAAGTRRSPHGEGKLEVRDASAYGTAVPHLQSDLRLADGQLQFNNIESSLFGAPVTGSTSVSVSGDAFHVSLTGHDLDLAAFPKLHGSRITVDGRADFTVQGAGTFEQPSAEAHIHLRDLAFDKERAGDFYADAVTQGKEMNIKARAEFEQGDLNVQGTVGMVNDFPADLKLSFRQLDVDSLLRIYIGDKVTSHSNAAGIVNLRGPLRHPRDLTLSANFDSLAADIEHVQLKNSEPIRVEMADRVLRLESLHLAGSGTDFTAHGTAQLAEPREVDFRLEGTVNMALLQTMNPKIFARGTVVVNLTANGTVAQPQLQGRLDLKDASISHNDFPSGLSGLNGVLQFEQNRIRIEQLSGTTGGGSISLTGSGSFQNGVLNMDLAATAHDVRLRYPPGVSSTANATLRLVGTSNSALLSGDVQVTKLGVTPGFDFGAYLERSKQSGVVTSADSLQNHIKLDVHVVTTPELQMQTAIAKLSGNADLRVRGTADRPVVTGRINSNEGGELSFNGTKYRIDRGDVSFSNPARTQPFVDIQASTRVRDYDITVNLSGDVSQPNGLVPKWRSEPPLPEADVINLLALGRTREESAALSSGGSSSFSGEASNLLISEALNTAVSSRVQRLFGVSHIKIDPQGLASETNVVRGPQVTIEQQVASNVTITYSTNVSVASQQIIQVVYNVSRNVSIVALRDQNGVVSFDIKVRQRKK